MFCPWNQACYWTSNPTTPQQLIIDYNLILLVIQVVSIMD